MEFLDKFQTGIVGLVGFIGVILTLYVNARLERQARVDRLNDERASIRAALIAELRIIRHSIEDAINTLGKGKKDGSDAVLVPTDTMSRAYETLLSKIGVFKPETVQTVMNAYLSNQEMRKNLTILPSAFVSDSHRVRVPKNMFSALRDMHKNLLPVIDDAIRVLSEQN